jgi:hypothetical protein
VEAARADDYTNDHPAEEQPEVREPIDEDRHGFEFRDGQWVEKNVGVHASVVASRLHCLIGPPVRSQRLGFVLNAEGGYRMFPDEPKRLVKPDLSFVRRDRLEGGRLPRGHFRLAPDLAVEIASPSDEAEDLMAKVVDYLRVGVSLVWVIYPLSKSILVLRADRSTYLWQPDSVLTAEEVIPGFSVRLEELFADLEAAPEE